MNDAALATAPSPNQSLIVKMAGHYGLEPQKFLGTLAKTIFPTGNNAPTQEQIAAFLVVANQYELNPFIKEIYAFPSRGGITPIVSIDGWVTIINRQPMLDGIEFEDKLDSDGHLFAVTARVYRKDRSRPTEVTEYMAECRRDGDVWKKWPSRMLRHKALIQAARYAFGLSGIYDPDEGERIAEGNGNGSPIAAKTQDRIAELKDKLTPTPTDPVDAEQSEQSVDANPEVIEGEPVFGSEADTEADTAEDSPSSQTAKAFEIYRSLDGEEKQKADKFLKTKGIADLGPDKLADFINIFGEKAE
jgi:phage recombination protein Bet